MSCFMLPAAHLAALGAALALREERPGLAGYYARCLGDANARSVAYRYGLEAPDAGAEQREEHAENRQAARDAETIAQVAANVDPEWRLPPLRLLRMSFCCAYQSCEPDDWKGTRACRLLGRLNLLACRELGIALDVDAIYDMPGFEEAPRVYEGPEPAAGGTAPGLRSIEV